MKLLGKNWQKFKLDQQLILAFVVMGLLVFGVGLLGKHGTTELAQHLNEVSEVRLPSIIFLQRVDTGLREVYAGELALLNSRLSESVRDVQEKQIEQAKLLIQEGIQKYEPLSRSQTEDKLWQQFIPKLNRWRQEDEKFLEIYQRFQDTGILNPLKVQVQLLREGKENSAEMENARRASILLEQLNVQLVTINQPAFNSAFNWLDKLIKENEYIANQSKKAADENIASTQFSVTFGMILGGLSAIGLGIALSLAIAKPLDKAISKIITKIVSSSSQIAATVAQQERISAEQATYVSQTTTTMDELAASSRQASEQAEEAATGAQEARTLIEGGTKSVKINLESMEQLQQKVVAIAQAMTRLNQQASQIAKISGFVGDLARQTNMLALNAAVEAVRAGEHGKGFSVVAAEIRKLADESQKASQKINGLVVDIQQAVESTVSATDDGTKTVQTGLKTVQKTATVFSAIAAAIEQIAMNNQQIALTSKQQAIAVEQVVMAMNSINVGAKQTSSGIGQMKIGIQQLNEASHHLKALGVT